MNKGIFSGRLGVFIDESNVYHSQKTIGWKIDYLKLKNYLEASSDVSLINLYTSYFDKNIFNKERFNEIEKEGYQIIKKKLKFIKNKKGDYIKKGNLDIELALDSYIYRNKYDVFVLFSGDSDFEYLIKLLKNSGKKIVIFSTRKHVSKELLLVSDLYIDLKKLTRYISK
jgi:uncharacterized LabA/DUF88 family protein